VELDGCIFKRMFVTFGAFLNGFILGCRKMLFVNGTHLSGSYEETLLVTVASDVDNCIFMSRMRLLEEKPVKIGCGF